jgi:hypothetical protein
LIDADDLEEEMDLNLEACDDAVVLELVSLGERQAII